MKKSLRSLLITFSLTMALLSSKVHAQLRVQTGKSYININKSAGGIIENGNELEIRAVISISSGTAYFVRYNDTIPAGTTYKPNSIRFATNEGLVYGTPLRATGLLTDAGADDEARMNAGVLRVNVGSLTRSGGQTNAYDAVAAPAVIDVLPSASGCTIRNTGRPSFYGSTVILMITYRVFVNTTAGNTFTIPGGSFRYKTANTQSETTLPSIVRNLNRMNVMVSLPFAICNSVGANSITGNGGNYGSGTTQNINPAPAPGTVVPGYQWQPFAAPSAGPNDSMFTVANNTSPTGSTNNNLAFPNSARQFSVWDIIGDHTNAADPLMGNPATTPGQPGGYMAVVNAAYGINNAVQQTVTGLCPDTYYEFSAWFRSICRRCSSDSSGKGSGTSGFKAYMAPIIPSTNDSAGVSPNLTFQVNGVDHYTTGNLAYTGQWVKKGFLYKTGPAETSVNIIIRNNAPGGGGNDWVMDDVAFATCLPELGMKPSNNPTYCKNAQVNMSVVVNSFYNSYKYYRWERSTDGGVTWNPAPLKTGVDSFTYTFSAPNYLDTVYYPSFLTTAGMNGHRYRIRTASSLANLSTTCAVYNTTNVVTLNINSTCDVLPAELINFKGKLENQYSELSWQTTKEQNHQYFDVERSDDGANFSFAGRINSINPNSNTTQYYTWNDPVQVTSKVYYRLKMVSENNTITKYSDVVVLGAAKDAFEIKSVVNPFNDRINAEIISGSMQQVTVQVADLFGRVIKEEKRMLASGNNTITIYNLANVQSANYILKIIAKGQTVQKIIVKN